MLTKSGVRRPSACNPAAISWLYCNKKWNTWRGEKCRVFLNGKAFREILEEAGRWLGEEHEWGGGGMLATGGTRTGTAEHVHIFMWFIWRLNIKISSLIIMFYIFILPETNIMIFFLCFLQSTSRSNWTFYGWHEYPIYEHGDGKKYLSEAEIINRANIAHW